MTTSLKLGLIGDNIARSRSPRLHRICGELAGIDVSYDRLIPHALGQSFEKVFADARRDGFDGVNVTYPYKERVRQLVSHGTPDVNAIGAMNTVLFNDGEPRGFNTDASGFAQAYRAARDDGPGVVCLIGAGGVGRAVAFALLALNAHAIVCVDIDPAKANALADGLRAAGTGTRIATSADPIDAASSADGLINCSPLGMVGIGGTPLPFDAMARASWAFDAVYTPVETPFLQNARRAGLSVISGFELFLAQGLDAWALFSGQKADPHAVRARLSKEHA